MKKQQNTNKDINKAVVYIIKEEYKKYFMTIKDSNIDWFLFKLKSFEQDLIDDILKCDVFKKIEVQINITLYENGIQTKTKTRLYKLLSGAIIKEGF